MMHTHELVWAAGLLESLPSVEVLGMRLDSEPLDDFNVRDRFESVRAVVVDVHAKDQASAMSLAESLGLPEVDGREAATMHGDGVYVYRIWQGWAADGSHDAPCWVKVFGSDFVPNEQHDPHADRVAA